MGIKGYKAMNYDWTCRGFHYEVGHTYEMDEGSLEICKSGFHFCDTIDDCFSYYEFIPERTRITEVEALGQILNDYPESHKYCTNKIKIIREIPWEEIYEAVNIGKNNIGRHNYGSWNQGWGNTGNNNIGSNNTGRGNIGSFNVGSFNIGAHNTGDNNVGSFNSGNYNTGDRCVGEWNSCDYAIGYFNTQTPKKMLFNKPYDETPQIRGLIDEVLHIFTSTPEPEGFNFSENKVLVKERAALENERQQWWNELSNSERYMVCSLPNFDKYVFYQVTGIKVE